MGIGQENGEIGGDQETCGMVEQAQKATWPTLMLISSAYKC